LARPCSFCGVNAIFECPLCGRIVCERHYNATRGLCTGCIEALCDFCNKSLSIARCIYCGRLGCDVCLVQVDNVRRACRECLDRRALRLEEAWKSLEALKHLTLRMSRA
jgi:hypothetical protein